MKNRDNYILWIGCIMFGLGGFTIQVVNILLGLVIFITGITTILISFIDNCVEEQEREQ